MRKAARFVDPAGGIRIGRLDGERITDAGLAGPAGFDAGPEAWGLIEDASGPEFDLAEVRLLAPVVPGKVLCVGSNYKDHIKESRLPTPEHPIIFTKLTTAVIGPDEPIIIPVDEPQTDWEAELALVIGRRTRRATGQAAQAAIGGVTCFNDVSGRWAQLTTGLGQYTRGKSFDTFGPLGPVVVHPDDLDMNALGIRLRLDGELMQDSNTRHLLFGPSDLVEWLSAASTLEPGDVIATGTPGGVGHAMMPPRYLLPGEVVEVEIEGIGILRNPVAAESVA
jgi:2-keto-4-pentenoate hydratase/2-oxohepta-3-ene-1,7-dioic acid hydratase in catechol pathway